MLDVTDVSIGCERPDGRETKPLKGIHMGHAHETVFCYDTNLQLSISIFFQQALDCQCP